MTRNSNSSELPDAQLGSAAQRTSNEPSVQRPSAIVVGLDDIRGVHAARTLARHGIRVIAIARDVKSYGCRTNVCQRILFADTRNEEFIKTLEELGPTFQQKPVLIACLDMAALQVSRYRERLEPWYRMTLPARDVVETLMDKVQFYRFAAKAGLPIPKTCFLSRSSDVDLATETLRFPCAVKPPNSKSPDWLSHTNVKAFKAANVEELRQIFDAHQRFAGPLIAQDWIEGPETELYACHCYFAADGTLLADFTSRKIRQWPPETGQGCLAEEVRNDTVRQITIDVFRSADYRGLGYVEVKRDQRSGDYFIVEPNIGRVSGRMAIAEAGGVELLHTAYCEAAGLPLPANREQRYLGAKWIYLRQDLQSTLYHLLRGQLSLRQWWRSVRGSKKYALFSWRDPGPFWGDLTRGVRLLTSASERKKRSPHRSSALAKRRSTQSDSV